MRVRTPDGFMTQQQADEPIEETQTCDGCNNDYPISLMEDEGTTVEHNGDEHRVCPNCYEEDVIWCENQCDSAIYNEGARYVQMANGNQHAMCDCCADERGVSCVSCDEYISDEDEHWYERNQAYYCVGCMPTEVNHVRNYMYNPTTNFRRLDWENQNAGKYSYREAPYFGIEIEVDTPYEDYQDVARKCELLHDESKTYLKEDSSTEGFEIVTQPMTFEFQKQMGWRNILNQVREEGGRGYDSGNCGIHVHISKASYSPLTWWKVLEFMTKCRAFVKMFAQRNGNYRWCEYKHPREYQGYNDRANCYPSNPDTRYVHVNFGDRQPTAEFRIFRSTTSHDRFWASIEFSYAVVEFCVNHGYPSIVRYDSEQVWNDFIIFIKEKTSHQTLLKHLIKRNLTNNALCA
jgi:hypothetical protein